MKLTKKQVKKLWGVQGPYSQVRLTLETRILDDRVSRRLVSVYVTLNPFTYELFKTIRELFADMLLQQVLDTSVYQGPRHGYVCCVFQQEYNSDQVMQDAFRHLEYAKQTVLSMHRFVLRMMSTNEQEKQ